MNRIIFSLIFVSIFYSCQTTIKEKSKIETNSKSNEKDELIEEKKNEIREEMKFDGLILGERIDGPANIRKSINGKILFTLNHKTLVECALYANDWYQIAAYIKMTPEQMDSSFILPNVDLYNDKNELIGRTIDTSEAYGLSDGIGFIIGLTFKDNIIPESIVENQLMNELKKNEDQISFKELDELMNNFEFESYDLHGFSEEYKVFFIYETYITDPSPRDRITLIFKNDYLNTIIHSRYISNENWKNINLIRGHQLLVHINMNKDELEKLTQKLNDFYSKID